MPVVVLLGGLLGVASAFEEATSGFDIGISSDGLWLAVAFASGATAAGWAWALARGAVVLTVANLAYYAVGGDAPNAGLWLGLGVAGGLFFGAAGRLWRIGSPTARLVAILSLASVLIAEGSEVLHDDGELDDAIELAVGCALPTLSARGARQRALAAAATAILLSVAATGALEPFVP